MANEVTLTELIGIISRLQLNYTFLAKSWYDIFYNPKPIEKVDINYYDDSGRMQVATIPNLAYSRQYFVQGEGSPQGVVAAAVGTIYQDTTSGDAYIKHYGEDESTTGWIKFISQSDIDKIIIHGSKSPEGKVVASPGTLYVDQDDNKAYLYMKRTTSGNTGWERIDSYPTSLVRQVYNVAKNTKAITIPMKCEAKNLLSIYVDGVFLNPDKYRLWNDQQTVEFGYYDRDNNWVEEPLNSPETEENIEVVIQYYTDIHLYDGAVTQEYNDLLNEVRTLHADTVVKADAAVAEMQAIREAFEIDLDTATTEATAIVMAQVAPEAEKIMAIAEKTENELANMSAVIKNEYRDINNWYTRVSQMQVSVAEMQRDVTTMKNDILTNANYIVAKHLINDLMLKSEFQPELDRIEAKITSEDSALRDEFTNNIARVDQDIQAKEGALQNSIDALNIALSTSDSEIRALLLNYENTNTSMHDNIDAEIADIKRTYFNDKTMPIGIKTAYQYNKNVNTDAKSSITNDSIMIDLKRDCMYYTVDLGEILNSAGRDITFGQFELRPGETFDSDVTEYIDPEVAPGDKINTMGYSNIMINVRVMFKNASAYKAIIDWGTSTMTWLGGEEPDLEPGKDYLIEFISYDIGTTWCAHVLGICQPTVHTDDIHLIFNIVLNGNTGDGEFDLYYDTDTQNNLYWGTYNSSSNVIHFDADTSRKYKGTVVKNLRAHKVGVDGDFVKHKVNDGVEFTLYEDSTIDAAIYFDNAHKVTDSYTFDLTILSNEIVEYMKQTEIIPVSTLPYKGPMGQVLNSDPTPYANELMAYINNKAIDEETPARLIQTTSTGSVYYGKITRIYEDHFEQDKPGSKDKKDIVYQVFVDYEINSSPVTHIAISTFLSNPEFTIELVSPYYNKSTGKYVCEDISLKMEFENGTTYGPTEPAFANVKYIYDNLDTYNSGIKVQLNTDRDIVVMTNPQYDEKTRSVENSITKVKVKYPGNEAGACLVSSSNSYTRLSLNGSAAISLVATGQWE